MMDLLIDVCIDTAKLIPVLFLTYILLSYMELKDRAHFHAVMAKYKFLGPLLGSLLGIIPQCGFSVMASCLYLNSSITIGTLLSVFFATSDEALPMLLAHPQSMDVLIRIIIGKIIFALLLGYLVDILTRFHFHTNNGHSYMEKDHCHSILREACNRTFSVVLFVFIFSLVLSIIMESVSSESVSSFMSEIGILQPLLCCLIGFIPNCASSIFLCELYLHGFIASGALFTGLSCNAGLGLMIFIRSKENWRALGFIVSVLFVASLCGGLLFSMLM